MTVQGALRKEKPLKSVLCILVTAVFVLSLIPVGWIARYDCPVGDDRVFGDAAATAFAETGSLGAAIRAAADVVVYKFYNWQGTYSAMFLMALHPGVFGAELYSITPFLMIGALSLSTLLLAYVLLHGYLGADFRTWWTIAVAALFFSVQLLPSAMEGFFWYNGAVYYTFYHSLFLTMASCLLLAWKTKKRGAKVALAILACLLAAVIAGGNYATLLPCGVLTFFAGAYLFAVKRGRDAWIAVFVLLVLAGGMLVSVLAPGNAVRQAEVSTVYQPSGPVKAILLSFAFAAAAVFNRFDTAAVLVVLLCAFLVTPFLKKTPFRFRYPVIVLLLGFCVFATQFTPTLYAATSPGPYRLRNIIFFNFYWMLAFDTIYVCGWCVRQNEKNGADGAAAAAVFKRSLCWMRTRPVPVILVVMLLTGAAVLQRNFLSTTTAAAVYELYTGTAARHGALRHAQYTGAPLPKTETAEGDEEENEQLSVLLP